MIYVETKNIFKSYLNQLNKRLNNNNNDKLHK